jgi:hypothetical protein
MWGQVTSIFDRFGRTARATEPCESTDFSTGVCIGAFLLHDDALGREP